MKEFVNPIDDAVYSQERKNSFNKIMKKYERYSEFEQKYGLNDGDIDALYDKSVGFIMKDGSEEIMGPTFSRLESFWNIINERKSRPNNIVIK